MDRFSEVSTKQWMAFAARQLAVWPMAKCNFEALRMVETMKLNVGGADFTIQHNPARMASTGAKTDKATLAARPCFLCAGNRPAEQMSLCVDGLYEVLVNPFPIFPVHFTIPAIGHVPQLITADDDIRFLHMMQMASRLPGLALFYNGPTCGASAPDHFHFQAVERGRLPMFDWVNKGTQPFRVSTAVFGDLDSAQRWFRSVCADLACLPENIGQEEPRMNILCSVEPQRPEQQGIVRVIVIPRRAHRPDFYGKGERQVLLSPASVDLAGVMVAPSSVDFHHKITAPLLSSLLDQTCYT